MKKPIIRHGRSLRPLNLDPECPVFLPVPLWIDIAVRFGTAIGIGCLAYMVGRLVLS